jgi:hypothetical protein
MSKRNYNKEKLEEAVRNSYSIAGVLRYLNIVPAGGNYFTIKRYIKSWDIDISHFTGKLWNKGKHAICNPAKPLEEILVEDSIYPSYKLAKRLIKAGLKETICECCKLSKWQNKPIPLELHHINGIHSDNRIDNLQLLCPNCHALTDNYRGKNIKKESSVGQ